MDTDGAERGFLDGTVQKRRRVAFPKLVQGGGLGDGGIDGRFIVVQYNVGGDAAGFTKTLRSSTMM